MVKKLSSKSDSEDSTLSFLINGVDIENRIIDVRGIVDSQMASVIIRSLMIMSAQNTKPINVMLSSPGGDVSDGLAIYDFIRACPCPVHIQANGIVASSAFIIFLAGDVRTATPHTSFMMHSIRYAVETTRIVKDHEIDVNESKRLNSVFQDIMASRTKRNKKWWYRTVSLVDKYFTVSEAMEVGILTEPKPVKKKVRNVRK